MQAREVRRGLRRDRPARALRERPARGAGGGLAAHGPVLVDVPVDYRHSADFLADLLPDDLH